MHRSLMGFPIMAAGVLGILSLGADRAEAQYPGGVVYETVAPATNSVIYGERTRVRYNRNKTVIRERPVAYVTQTPAVVRETRYVQSAPVVESRLFQPAPVVESRLFQPAPVVESRLIQPGPVIQTRYISSYPY